MLKEAYNIHVSRRVKSRLEKLALRYFIKKALDMEYTTPREIGLLIGYHESKIRRVLREIKAKASTSSTIS